MNTKATPHKWLYFVSKHAAIIVKFPSINFFLSHFKYFMRLTYTLLVISLHKINVRVCSSFKYMTSNRTTSQHQSFHKSFYSVAARATFDALAASGVRRSHYKSLRRSHYKSDSVNESSTTCLSYCFIQTGG